MIKTHNVWIAGDVLDLTINGIKIGDIRNVKENDSDGKLVQAINALKDKTGAEAYIDNRGHLNIFSIDGRKAINDIGEIRTKGDFTNLPAGETFIAPVEGTGIPPSNHNIWASVEMFGALNSLDVRNDSCVPLNRKLNCPPVGILTWKLLPLYPILFTELGGVITDNPSNCISSKSSSLPPCASITVSLIVQLGVIPPSKKKSNSLEESGRTMSKPSAILPPILNPSAGSPNMNIWLINKSSK